MPPIWLDVLDETVRLCAVHGRADLTESLRHKRKNLLDPHLGVLVLGQPKQGKSQLINALINAAVCPVGDGVTTAVPTIVRHADEPFLTETPQQVEVGLPRALLATGMVLVDTPGMEGHDAAAVERLCAQVPADVVVLVSDATRELSGVELSILVQLAQSHARIVVAMSKIDISPHWRQMLERNRHQLLEVGVPAVLIPVSATLRLQAAHADDHVINQESGFPTLIATLRHDHSTKSNELARASVSLIARTIVEQLARPLRHETPEPDRPPGSLSKLEEAQRAVEDLRRCSARWQSCLNDEIADLVSDLEYDLHDRTRKILREVDESFDKADPLDDWDEFATWLEENLFEAAEANYGWMVQRGHLIIKRTADNFVTYGYGYPALPAWSVKVPADLAEQVPPIDPPPVEEFTWTQKVFTGVRGSYGGILMVGLATSLAGMPLINPFSIGAGALFGGKTIFDESRSLLRRRQATAKAAAQRHIDDFFLRFSKDRRDGIRHMQRTLREHFTATTEELQEALVNSFKNAKQAADADATQRDQRMKQLAALHEQARALIAAPRLEPVP